MLWGKSNTKDFYLDEIIDIIIKPEESIYFFNKQNKLLRDIPVANLPLTIRDKKKLNNHNINFTSQLENMRLEDMWRIHGFGEGAYIRFQRTLNNINYKEISIEKTKLAYDFSYICNLIQAESRFKYEQIIPIVYKQININKIYKNNPDFNERILNAIYLSKEFEDMIKDTIIKHVKKNENAFKEEELINQLFFLKIPTLSLQKLFNSLIAKGSIYKWNGIIKYRFISLDDYLQTLDESRDKKVLIARINGETLQMIGIEDGITRERVRQIESSIVKNIPTLYEDRYKDLFEKYNFDEDSFTSIFSESKSVYKYVSYRYENGTVELIQALNNEDVTLSLKKKFEQYIFRHHVHIGGEKVLPTRNSILRYLIKANFKQSKPTKLLMDLYNNFIIENHIDLSHENNFRSFEGIIHRRDDVIASRKKNIRYYPIYEYDFTNLLDAILHTGFNNIEISTLKIYKDNPLLMEEYDIKEEYELHNLLKSLLHTNKNQQLFHLKEIEKLNINFGRMPMISIGNANRGEQVLELLVDTAPIAFDDFTRKYHDAYGVLEGTIKANFLDDFTEFLEDGVYNLEKPSLLPDEFLEMKKILVEDFYTIDNIKLLYSQVKTDDNKNINKINTYSLHLLGYQPYSGHFIKNIHINGAEFVRSLFKETLFNMEDFNPSLKNGSIFQSELYEQKKNYDVIEIIPSQYGSIKYLNENGVTKKDLIDFCNKVYNFLQNDKIFTIHFLKKNGFSHELLNYGFGNWFYGSILAADSRFVSRRMVNYRIFSSSTSPVLFSDLINEILQNIKSISILKLIDILRCEYGIIIQETNIKNNVSNTKLYYSHITEKLYLDYNTYLQYEY